MADEQLDAIVAVARGVLDEPALLSASVYGSSVAGGLRPDSDLDVLTITARRLTRAEKAGLVAGLMPISGRQTRPPEWRPVELTVVAIDEVGGDH